MNMVVDRNLKSLELMTSVFLSDAYDPLYLHLSPCISGRTSCRYIRIHTILPSHYAEYLAVV